MVDFPNAAGPMFAWDRVAAVDGARETLAALHRQAGCWLATNARDSKERDIVKALERVGLAAHLDGVFCFDNLGCRKPSPAFFAAIIAQLGTAPGQIVMVGDSLETDIASALSAGLHGIWYNPDGRTGGLAGAGEIHNLMELVKPEK
jgi:putative hydrolase of the HAD superfamily